MDEEAAIRAKKRSESKASSSRVAQREARLNPADKILEGLVSFACLLYPW